MGSASKLVYRYNRVGTRLDTYASERNMRGTRVIHIHIEYIYINIPRNYKIVSQIIDHTGTRTTCDMWVIKSSSTGGKQLLAFIILVHVYTTAPMIPVLWPGAENILL